MNSSSSSGHGRMVNKSSSVSRSQMVTLDVLEEKEFPSLCTFPHGIPKTIEEANISAKRKRGEKITKSSLQVDLGTLVYKGYDFGENSWKKNFHNYAVGVMTGDGKLKVYPCTQAFVMRPEASNKEFIPEQSLMSSMEKRESLTNEFGSKKKKRMMNAAKSNTISTDNISGANELQNILTVKSSEQDVSLLKAAEDVVNKIRKKKRTSY